MYEKDKELVPEVVRHVCKCLKIPINACSSLSSDRLVCVVPVDWLKTLHRCHVSSATDYTLDACTLERFLSRSCDSLPHPWKRISVKVLTKSDDLYRGLSGDSIEKHWCCGSLYEFMSHIAAENVNNLWLRSHRSLKSSHNHHRSKSDGVKLSSLMKQLILRLGPSVYVNLIDDIDNEFTAEMDGSSSNTPSMDHQCSGSRYHSRGSSFYTTVETFSYQGMVSINAVIEAEHHFFLIQPYLQHTLRDVVMFSPSILDNSHAKSLFIVYQLLQAMHSLHSHGLRLGNAQISSLIMDKNMWLRVCGPRLSTLKPFINDLPSPDSEKSSLLSKTNSSVGLSNFKDSLSSLSLPISQSLGYPGGSNDHFFQSALEFLQTERYKHFEIEMLPSIVNGWVNRSVTNFQYLMILNHLAGRRMGDPNNHPVLPWIMDFSAPDSGYRDLTKSKFRLNKGDGQLDFTFNEMQELNDGTAHVPHHVSDILSDITYYVYTARRTPKNVLCAHVRSNWVPHEYPQSMHRLQGWTPDECIPEFFIDPTIFDSIHDDLPDLEIPVWCKNTLDFVVRHLAALESDHVSSHIHHWIDLTFGYKLTGLAAERAKNVHLHLVDKHTNLMSHGATQLFQEPHPQRTARPSTAFDHAPRVTRGLLESQLQTYGFPSSDSTSTGAGNSDLSESGQINQTAIHLPLTFNPLADLERCEVNLRFNAKVLHTPAASQLPSPQESSPTSSHEEEMTDDMVAFLCLVCEMLLDSKLRMQDSRPALFERVNTLRQLCTSDNMEIIQGPFQRFVREMFDNLEITPSKTFAFQTVFPDGSPPPTPTYLLQTYSDLIPFPPYFNELFACLSKIVDKTREIEHLQYSRITVVERINKIKQLEREKVPILENFLWKHQGYLGTEGMGLILPYVQDLLHNQYTTVQAAWALFNVVARELGPGESSKQFLPQLTALFSGEVTSAKHIKLYHRSFLMQLILRLGLKQFLTNFSTLLVEAVAGYKDFSVHSKFYSEELLEDLNQENLMKSSSRSASGLLGWRETDYTHPALPEDVIDGEALDEDDDVDEEQIDQSDDLSDTIVDRMSLNGDHVLLEGEDDFEIDSTVMRQGGETDSLASETSEDRELSELTQRRLRPKDETDGNADQHSIHSISLLVPKDGLDRESSPSCFDQDVDVDTQEESQDQQSTVPRRKKLSNERNSESDIDDLKEKEKLKEYYSQSDGTTRISKISQSLNEKSIRRKNVEIRKEEEYSSEKQDYTSKDSDENSSKDLPDGNVSYRDPHHPFQRFGSKSDMVRSETEDLMMNLSAEGTGSIINIRDISADSVKWLCHKLGPVLATKFLSRNLLRMLALCYLGVEQMQAVENNDECNIKTSRLVSGDLSAQKVLECITFTAVLYGEQVVLIQCLPNIMDMITMAQKRLTPRSESGLISCMVLLCVILPYMSDTSLMDVLQDCIIANCINPVLTIISSQNICFPSGVISRFVLVHKLVDLFYSLGLRLGFEMTRRYLNSAMLRLFSVFSSVHGQSPPCMRDTGSIDPPPFEVGSGGSDETFLNIQMDALTHQYHIGSPVDLRTIKSPPKRHLSKMHSLSFIGNLDEKDDYVDSKNNASTAEKCAHELGCVFCPELAQACYIPLCRIFGSIHMEENLRNDDLIRQLCNQHDIEMDKIKPDLKADASKMEESNKIKSSTAGDMYVMSPMEEKDVVGGIGSNVAIVGNRIQLHEDSGEASPPRQELSQFGRGYKHSGILSISLEDLRSSEMDQNTSRHLSGNWLAYWERELGLHERNTMFNFMQIELQTFSGHTNSIRSIHSMDTENCFISASKDKTVRLWSINNNRNSTQKQNCQFCYTRHKKSVFSVAYVDSMRLVASCDSTVHVWDPYTGVAISQLESPRYSPVIALTALPAPSTLVAMATNETTLRFLDMRTSKYTHSFRTCVGNSGLIRCIAVSPDGTWIAVGFTSGFIFILDINSGIMTQFWKAHDSEVIQLKAYNNSCLLSSAFDQTIKLWNVETGQEASPSKVQSEAVHCMCLYRDQLITATAANKISIYSAVKESTALLSSKLRSSAFKGVLTHMSVLPLNKALLLGADNGAIHLMT